MSTNGRCFAGIKSLGTSEKDVELMERENAQQQWVFAINHSDTQKKFQIDHTFHMIKGKKEGELEGFEVQIFERNIY